MGEGVFVDLANIQAWQAVVAVIGALGLSPAPWILGLAFGRIQFTTPAERSYSARVEDLKNAHAAAVAELVKHHDGTDAQWQARYDELKLSRDEWKQTARDEGERADLATHQLAELGTEATKLAASTIGAVTEGQAS